jgi:hypothetical protein
MGAGTIVKGATADARCKSAQEVLRLGGVARGITKGGLTVSRCNPEFPLREFLLNNIEPVAAMLAMAIE